jgi:hypothetical protein
MGSPNKYFDNNNIGLPSINIKVHRMKRALENRSQRRYTSMLKNKEDDLDFD